MKKSKTNQMGICPEDQPESDDPRIRRIRALQILSPTRVRCDDSVKADHEPRERDSLSAPPIPSYIRPPTRFEIPKTWKGKVTEVVWDSDKPISENMKSGIKRQQGVEV
jgi:hypothetical protein